LVIRVVTQQHVRGTHRLGHLGQRTVTALAGSSLRALSRCVLSMDVLDMTSHTPTLTLPSNMVFKTVGSGL
jgi:hypothetical protein